MEDQLSDIAEQENLSVAARSISFTEDSVATARKSVSIASRSFSIIDDRLTIPQDNPSATPSDVSSEVLTEVSMTQSDVLSDLASEVIIMSRIKYGNCFEATKGIFMEYCRNSSIHGIRYLGQRKRPLKERIFWILVFIISVYICGRLTKNIWLKWNRTPVVVHFDEKTVPIWDIPFPSVVICSETKTRRKDFDFSKVYKAVKDRTERHNISDVSLLNLQAVMHLCQPSLADDMPFDSNLTINIEDILLNISQPMNSSTPFCMFRNNPGICEIFLSTVLTDDGICFQFNGLDESEVFRDTSFSVLEETSGRKAIGWNRDTGYTTNSEDVYPYRVIMTGPKGGLFFMLQGYDYDLENICRGSTQGFRVYLHSPDEAPQALKQFIRVPFGQEVLISVNPKYVTTSNNLLNYLPEQRQCFFNYERFLRYFRTYTQKNCEFECLVNFTIETCGCVKYSMPKPDGIRTCGIGDIDCYSKAEDYLLSEELESSKSSVNWRTACYCLPSCTSLDFDFEISEAHINVPKLFQAWRHDYGEIHPGFLMSRVVIFFKEQYFTPVKRSALYGTADFIANCGGLMALFMGISALSLIELVYFCTARFIFNIRLRRRKQADVLIDDSRFHPHTFQRSVSNRREKRALELTRSGPKQVEQSNKF